MNRIFYITIFLLSHYVNGQNANEIKDFRVDLLTIEKNSKEIIAGSIIEIFSGGKRIETDVSDFDGISIFLLNSEAVVDNKIRLIIYGPKCKRYTKKYYINSDLKININLKYGKTKYQTYKDYPLMLSELNIKPKPQYE